MDGRRSLEALARQLRLGELEEPFRLDWSASLRSLPRGPLPFLSEEFVRESAAAASLPGEAVERLAEVAARCRRDPDLSRLLWHEHRLFTGAAVSVEVRPWRLRRRAIGPPMPEGEPAGFPDLSAAVGEDAPAVNLLLVLSAVPNARWFYERRRLPGSVLSDTLSDIALRSVSSPRGVPGIDGTSLSWLRHHLRGRLFRLGRLQFMAGSFERWLTVYRSAATSRVRALAAPGLVVDARGLLRYEGGGEGEWVTARRSTGDALVGNPVLPDGTVARREVALDLADYRPVLRHRSPVLEIHVPAGSPLLPQACAESIAQACEFFPRYLPERAFLGFTCESWFLGRELLDLLPPGSNIRRFAAELYLYPCMGGEEEAGERIFGPAGATSPSAGQPRTTALQRSAADHLSRGGTFRLGGGFLLAEELPWGRGAYRSAGRV